MPRKKRGYIPCSFDACEGDVKAKGLCSKHYARLLRYGDAGISRICRSDSDADRFRSFVTITDTDDCIEWPGHRKRRGYGALIIQSRQVLAHRLSFSIHNGPLSADGVVRHKCDNPPCVNPRHLESGTIADNNADCLERGRVARGERAGLAVLTNNEVRRIKLLKGTMPSSAIAKEHGVSNSAIKAIFSGKNWSWM